MTVDTHGSWLPVEAPGAVNVLAEGLLILVRALVLVLLVLMTGQTNRHQPA